MMQLVVCSLLVVAVSCRDYRFQQDHDDAVRQLIGTLSVLHVRCHPHYCHCQYGLFLEVKNFTPLAAFIII